MTGQVDGEIKTYELWKQTYPRDNLPHENLPAGYSATGQHERTIEESNEALRMDPTIAYDYTNLAGGYMALNRFDDSKAALEKALAQKLDWVGTYGELYRLALQRENTKAAQQYAEKLKAYPLERPNSYYPIMNLVSQCKLHEANRSNGTLRQPGATNLQDALPGLGHSGL